MSNSLYYREMRPPGTDCYIDHIKLEIFRNNYEIEAYIISNGRVEAESFDRIACNLLVVKQLKREARIRHQLLIDGGRD